MSSDNIIKRVASRHLQSSWDEYYDEGGYEDEHLIDQGVEVDTPDKIIDEKVGLLSKQVKPLVKKMLQTYKRMGFKVRIWDNGGDFDTYEENLTTIMYQFELSLKGGQKIVIDRKQMVASGNYKFEFDAYFHSDDDTEIEKGDENYEEQIDVDEFNEYPTWYYVPSGDFDYFSLGSDDLERFGKREYSAREIEKACKESVYFLFKDLSGKWRKKRASVVTREDSSKQRKSLRIIAEVPTFKQGSLVQKVALLKLQKIARLESHADFVKAINYAFKNREDESMLSSIRIKARNLKDKEFGKEISDLCKMLIGRLKYIEELRRDSTGWGAFDSKPDPDDPKPDWWD